MAAQDAERSPVFSRRNRPEGPSQGHSEQSQGSHTDAKGSGEPQDIPFINEPMANGPKITLINDLDSVANRIHADVNLVKYVNIKFHDKCSLKEHDKDHHAYTILSMLLFIQW